MRPTTPYEVTKVATELFGKVYNELYGMSVISLRITEVYDPGNKMPQILRDIIKQVLKGEAFALATGTDHRFQFIHVEDVVEATILASEAEKPEGYVFNISGGGCWTLREAADIIRRYLPDALIDIDGGHRHLDRQGPWDISAASQQLGFRPTWTLGEGVKQYIEWLRGHEY